MAFPGAEIGGTAFGGGKNLSGAIKGILTSRKEKKQCVKPMHI